VRSDTSMSAVVSGSGFDAPCTAVMRLSGRNLGRSAAGSIFGTAFDRGLIARIHRREPQRSIGEEHAASHPCTASECGTAQPESDG